LAMHAGAWFWMACASSKVASKCGERGGGTLVRRAELVIFVALTAR
jgi:hypothetical protein